MAGFDNDILYADNVDFRGLTPVVGQVTLDGQLLIGAAVAPFIRANTLTAGSGISITNSAGSITITNTGGGGGGGGTESLAGNSGSATEVGGVINVIGATNITTTGAGQTLTITPTGNLLGLAGLAGTGYVVQTGAGTFANRTFLAGSGITLTNASGVAGATTITADTNVPTTFTSDAGAATPAANNLNVLGGTGIDTTGAGSTLTVTFDVTEVATIATSYTCDAGSAIPAANVLTVAGGTGCATSGAGSTVTVNVDAAVPLSFPTDAGTATPVANALTIAGGTGCATTGAGATVTVNLDATVPLSFPADTGTATPAGNALTIAGGTGCATTGVGSTITVNVDTNVPITFAADAGSATPAANTITMAGGTGIATSGAGSTVTFDLDGPVALTYTTDSGVAVPTANNLNVVGTAAQGISTSGAGSTVTVTAANATTASKGVASFDSSDFTVVAGHVSLLTTGAIQTLTPDTGGAISPTSNNINLLGYDNGSFSLMDTHNVGSSTMRVENRTWQTPLVVDSVTTVGERGTFSTIQAAITAASSGQTIFIRSGTYTENLTLKAGVNLTSFSGNQYSPTVVIIGKCSFTGAGTVNISNLELRTNGDFFLEVTGAAASVVNVQGCFLNCDDNTGINYTTSSSSSSVSFFNCRGDLGTTGIAYFASSSTGEIFFEYCSLDNGGGSNTASTVSAGTSSFHFSRFNNTITTSGTAAFAMRHCRMLMGNRTCLNLNSTSGASQAQQCVFTHLQSNNQVTFTVGAGAEFYLINCTILTSNANFSTGAGTLNYSPISFEIGTNATSTVTTQSFKPFGPVVAFPSGPAIQAGSGSPNGSVTASKGSLFLRTDGTTTNNRAYINTNGGTTWTALTTVA